MSFNPDNNPYQPKGPGKGSAPDSPPSRGMKSMLVWLLIIGMVVLVTASAANAFSWSLLWSLVVPVPAPPGGQAQVGVGVGTSGVVGQGSYSNSTSASHTQPTPVGTQSSSIYIGQSGNVSGSPSSWGVSSSTVEVFTFQYHQVY